MSDKQGNDLIKKRATNNNPSLSPHDGGQSSGLSGGSRPSSAHISDKLYNKQSIQMLNNKRNLNAKILMKPSIMPSHSTNATGLLKRPVDPSKRQPSPTNPSTEKDLEIEQEDDTLSPSIFTRLKNLEQLNTEQKVKIKDLQEVNEKQKKQIEKQMSEKSSMQSTMNTMIRFLNDSGIKHPFGEEIKVKREAVETPTQETKTRSDEDLGPRLNMKLLEKRIESLNKMVDDEDLVEISRNNGNIKQLKPKPYCHVTFWKNGIVVDNGPFRPYKWDLTKAFLTDILDGYFPYEFKEKHPDGVKLKLVDKTREPFSREVEKSISMSNFLKENDSNIKGMDYLKHVDDNGQPNAPLDKKSLLEKLPKQVVKNGKIIQIREDVEKLITKSSSGDNSQMEIMDPACNGVDPKELCTIKLRYNSKQFTIVMPKQQTIANLRALVLPHLEEIQFRLKAIPNTFFDDETQTLEQGKLYPKAVLLVIGQ